MFSALSDSSILARMGVSTVTLWFFFEGWGVLDVVVVVLVASGQDDGVIWGVVVRVLGPRVFFVDLSTFDSIV